MKQTLAAWIYTVTKNSTQPSLTIWANPKVNFTHDN